MTGLFEDLRYTLRQLRKSPGFTVAVVLTLALGIGANTAIFSVIHAVLLRSLPYPDSGRLVILQEYSTQGGPPGSVSWMNYLDWRQRNQSFSDMAAYNTHDFNFTGAKKPEVIHAARVTSSFFSLCGATTVVGRAFRNEEDQPDADRTAILSYAFWRTHFAANSGVLGSSINLDGKPYSVIGVLPPDFNYFVRPVDLYVPAALSAGPGSNWLSRGNHPSLRVLARLRPGSSVSEARADMDVLAASLEKEYPEVNGGQRASVIPLYESRYGDVRPALLTLLAGVGCVLLIACVNVANLALARAAARRREFSVRAAIGAGRRRIIRQLLTESVLLALFGGAFGLLLASWSIHPLLALAPADIPRLSDTVIDRPVFLFNLAVALLTGILFGVAPAFETSRVDLTTSLRESAQASLGSLSGQRLRTGLLISEVAIAVVLVVASGLLGRSLLNALAVDPGFRADHLLAVDVNLPEYVYQTDSQQKAFLDQLLAQARQLPGVRAASAAMCPPLVGTCWSSIFILDDRPVPPVAELPVSAFNITDTDYFRSMGIPLVAGRWFTAADTATSTPVLVINETAARRFWPNQNPIGKRIKQGFPQDKEPFREVVGVVGDLKEDGPDQPQWAEMFQPEAQNTMTSFTLVLRTATEPMAVAPEVERIIHILDPDQPVYHVKAMTQYLTESLSRRKFAALLLGVFGALALLLAAVGTYGVISYVVAQRTREIGVRMALGARRNQVLAMVIFRGAKLAAIGVFLGVLAALVVTRAMASLLFGVSAADPWTFGVVTVLLAGVALTACYLPARRAAGVEPMVALRCE
jgi:putative ABC transport system permease protein